MYRAVTLYFHQNSINTSDHKAIAKALSAINISFQRPVQKAQQTETCLNGVNVEEEIRKMYISEMVSEVSAIPQVRKTMVAQQQQLGKHRGVVMDGRDIGTKVFPNAEVKIFMQADLYVRAERMQKVFQARNQQVSFDQILQNIKKRDHLDTTRSDSPLVKVSDAILLDVTSLTIKEQADFVIKLARNYGGVTV